MTTRQRWEITILTSCTEAEAEAALEPLLDTLGNLNPPLGGIIGLAPFTAELTYVDD